MEGKAQGHPRLLVVEQVESEAWFPPRLSFFEGYNKDKEPLVHLPGSFPLSNTEVEKDPEKHRNSHSVLLYCQPEKGSVGWPAVLRVGAPCSSLDRVKDTLGSADPAKPGSNPVSKMTQPV